MSHWNHRVIRATDPTGETYYTVHECFYRKDGDKIPYLWTEGPARPIGESVEDLRWSLEKMAASLSHPILEERGKKRKKLVPIESGHSP